MQLRKLLSLLLTSVTAGIAAAIVLLFVMPEVLDQLRPQPVLNTLQPQAVEPRTSAPFSYAGAVATAAPSVVNIYTTKITTELQTLGNAARPSSAPGSSSPKTAIC